MACSVYLLYYIAGLFDGEGNVGLVKHVRKNRPSPNYYLRTQIANKHRGVLETAQLHFNGKIYKDRTNCYRWLLNRKEAIYFLKHMEELCIIKQSQITAALAWDKEENKTPEINEFYWQELRQLKSVYV